MNPLEKSQPYGEMQRWLEEAQAGSDESLQKMLSLSRDYLLAIASDELPDAAGREPAIHDLVNRVLLQVSKHFTALVVASDADVRLWLRQVFRDQLLTEFGQRRGGADPGPTVGPARGLIDTHRPGDSSRPVPLAAMAPPARPPGDGHPRPFAAQFPEGTSTDLERTVPDAGGVRPLPGLPRLEGFEDISEIAASNMGVVYRAWQRYPRRRVALKCLPAEFAENRDRLARFRREADLAAGLTEHGIVPVLDVLEIGNMPVLVLPYIDGCDLHKILNQRRQASDGHEAAQMHPLAVLSAHDFVTRLLPFFDKVLDALVSLHGAGILHRDLKPSNILVDKNCNGWLTDFGLARLNRSDTATEPVPRQTLGTRGYMSPEQWEGDQNIDARADVFSMGVTLCEALTLELPYGKYRLCDDTPPLTELPGARKHRLPKNLDLVLLKAIQPDREKRYQTAGDLRADWQRVRAGLLPQIAPVPGGRRLRHFARRPTTLAGAFLVVVAILGGLVFAPRGPVVRTVLVKTEPPGARVALVPLDPDDGTPQMNQGVQPAERTPVKISGVRPGDYLVVVDIENHGFHEVYRRVPDLSEKSSPVPKDRKVYEVGQGVRDPDAPGKARPMQYFPHREFDEHDGLVELPLISVPSFTVATDMVLFQGGEFTMGDAKYGPAFIPPHTRSVRSYYLDKTEVTVAEFLAVVDSLPKECDKRSPKGDEAVCFVTFDQAVCCAERMGKRLPDEAEYEFAATNAGKNAFPWGDDLAKITAWTFGPVGSSGYDRAAAEPAVCGLFSNVAEWTSSWLVPYPGAEGPRDARGMFRKDRVVRGGTYSVVLGNSQPCGRNRDEIWTARLRQGIDPESAHPGLGFRCARSFKPRFPEPADKTKR